MQNIVIDMCEKFHNDRLRNDRALVLWKSNNNNLKKKDNNNRDQTGSKSILSHVQTNNHWWKKHVLCFYESLKNMFLCFFLIF